MANLSHLQVDLVNIGGTDIVDGNHKLTLGLIWSIILHWQVKINDPWLMFVFLPFPLPASSYHTHTRLNNATVKINVYALVPPHTVECLFVKHRSHFLFTQIWSRPLLYVTVTLFVASVQTFAPLKWSSCWMLDAAAPQYKLDATSLSLVEVNGNW